MTVPRRQAHQARPFKTSISILQGSSSLQIELETSRLFIRSYHDEDFENCLKLYEDPIATKYFDYGRPQSKKEVSDYISEKGSKYFIDGQPFGLFAIFRKDDMRFIGLIDLLPTEEPGILEIGFILNPKYHNQGFCTEAVKAFLFDYIDELNSAGYRCKGSLIQGVMATVHPENSSSKKVVEKIGMRFEKFLTRFGHPRLWYMYRYPSKKR
jgi:[ribosomal protein S5]-alanine N-acetyltransferase